MGTGQLNSIQGTPMWRIFSLTLLGWAMVCSLADSAENSVWEKPRLPEAAQGRNLHGVYFLDAKHGWVVGDKGLCLATHDGGATWEVKETASGATLRCVQFQDAQTGWICGDGDPDAPKTGGHVVLSRPLKASTLLYTKDGGKTWQTFWLPTNFDIPWIEASAAPLLQIGVSGGEGHLDGDITRSPDGGKTWKSGRCAADRRETLGSRGITGLGGLYPGTQERAVHDQGVPCLVQRGRR